MTLVGSEERALWAAAAARALGKIIVTTPTSHDDNLRHVTVEHAAAYADKLMLEYRKRVGSHP